MEGITYIPDFLPDAAALYDNLNQNTDWDERMHARKTASFGVAYNYSQISYPDQPFTKELEHIIDRVEDALGFRPNNCLLNFYPNGRSTMGWHSDQTDILERGTGVAIVSLGDTRVLRFREIALKDNKISYELPAGSLIYMTQEVQDKWNHSVPKSPSEDGRMSLTFRKIVEV